MNDLTSQLPVVAGLVVVAGVNVVLIRQIRAGTLRRNMFVGIRTRASMLDDDAWRQSHQAALSGLVWAAWLAGAAVIVSMAVRVDWVSLATMAAPLVAMLLAAFRGDRAARSLQR